MVQSLYNQGKMYVSALPEHTTNTTPALDKRRVLEMVCLEIIHNIEFDKTARARWEDDGGASVPVHEEICFVPIIPHPNNFILDNLIRRYEQEIIKAFGR